MYNVLVVDDEKLMRTYLAQSIPLFHSDFLVTGIAKDGQDAVDILNRQQFHVVITDIQMPEIDGLCLAKYIQENFPDIIVIIISGYNDFEYAQKAIRYHVTDYLLKPLVDSSLIELLSSVADRLHSEASPKFLPGKAQSEEYSQKQKLLIAVITENNPQIYELYTQNSHQRLLPDGHFGCLIKFTPDPVSYLLSGHMLNDVTTEHLKLNKLLEEARFTYHAICLYHTDGASFVFLEAESKEKVFEKISLLYTQITAPQTHMPQIRALCSRIISDMMELSSCMQDISEDFASLLLQKQNPVFHDKIQAQTRIPSIEQIRKLSETIFSDFLTGSVDRLYTDAKEFLYFLGYSENWDTVLHRGLWILQYISERTALSKDILKNACQTLTEGCRSSLPPEESVVLKLITQSIIKLFPHDKACPIPESMQIVTMAKEYILSHYHENISLSDTASYCGVNASYLSDLFHRKLEESYSRYLLRIRMEQAGKLLRASGAIRIYEVAERTGFVSVKHFNTVFKKYYGVTPTEYMKNYK